MNPDLLQRFIPIAGLLAVGFAILLARDVLSRDTGTKEMMDVSRDDQTRARSPSSSASTRRSPCWLLPDRS